MPALAPPTLGTDEFAFRKGRTYGTVLVDVDVESARPVDVLPARETSRVATWLQDHPGTEIICRDRLMAFTQAIKQPAPEALEVADRWRLQNLPTAVEKTCCRHRDCLRQPAGPEGSPPLATPETPLLDRIRQRHAEVNDFAASGMSLNAIARRRQLARKTVRRATGTRTWQVCSPPRRIAAAVSSTRSWSTCSTAFMRPAPVTGYNVFICGRARRQGSRRGSGSSAGGLACPEGRR
ncbi:transposase [Streptomyces sp. A1136]|uniref:transposase n=1 Tax=Streptomyces sp. A1136 TaxID=2563102 RepID=UPI0034D2C94D